MKKIFKYGFVLFFLIKEINSVQANSDIVFVDRMLISNSVASISLNPLLPGESVDVVRSNDEIIYYVANIGVINPTKKKYDVDVICTDFKGKTIYMRNVKRSLSGFLRNLGGDIIKGFTLTVGLDPKSGAMIKGQLIPLVSDNDYFIKLYFEKKLVGLTKFNYKIDK